MSSVARYIQRARAASQFWDEPFILFQISSSSSHSRMPPIMPPSRLLNRAIVTTLIAAGTAAGIYAVCVAQRIVSINTARITRTRTTTSEFKQSAAILNLANPRRHQSLSDTRSIAIDIPPQHRDISDQALLATCIKGFYGGLVLGPERALLKLLGARLVRFLGTLRSR